MSFCKATIFTTALCNLNCSYCYICKDKAGGLGEIDKDIEASLSNGTYINQILSVDERIRDTLDTISLWGGEPFLHVERFLDKIEDWLKAFPNVYHFDTSTNFTVPHEVDKLERLISLLEKKGPLPRYTISFQISIDGYPAMTDAGRGAGVTEKFLQNWQDLCKIRYNTNKIQLIVTTKPTLSKATFQYLDSVEKCEEWFRFFDEEMHKLYRESQAPFDFFLSLFNCAAPTEWVQEDGKTFAKICDNLSQIDIKKYPGWRDFFSPVPMANNIIQYERRGLKCSAPQCGGSCGAFVGSIVPIPNGNYTVCHRGLFDNYVEYCNNIDSKEFMNGLSKAYFSAYGRNRWILTKDELLKMRHHMEPLHTCLHHIPYTDYVVFIREYARCGIIDSKYINVKEIEPTLPHYLGNSYCMQDGFIQTGSWTTMATYEVPLMYNGAMDVALREVQKYFNHLKEGCGI